MSLYLDMGSGPEPHPGYVGVDLLARAPGIIQAEMDKLPMFANDSVDGIWSCHALEHLEKRRIVPALAEWFRILKDGAQLVIEVPDLVWCVTEWLKRQTGDWWLDTIFGNQDDAGQFHHTGFTPGLLLQYLDLAGYTGSAAMVAEVWNHEQRTIHIEVTINKAASGMAAKAAQEQSGHV